MVDRVIRYHYPTFHTKVYFLALKSFLLNPIYPISSDVTEYRFTFHHFGCWTLGLS